MQSTRAPFRLPTLLVAQLPTSSSNLTRLAARHFASSSRASAAELDHYKALGVPRHASKKEIKEKFYELSRKYHPDAPSSTSESHEARTAHFQSLSHSYSILSDDSLRRQYDAVHTGGSRPRYQAASSGMSGFGGSGGAAGSAWSTGENDARRERANYAWQHPSRRANEPGRAEQAASARPDPFRRRGTGDLNSAEDHFHTFATREAKARSRAAAAQGRAHGSRFTSGTAVFGAKAEEESRLINDSATKRTGQVFFVFAGAFFLSWAFSGGHDRHDDRQPNKKR